MILNNLKSIIRENVGVNQLYLRNLLKENLQYYVLNFIYNSKWGENLLLKGGSCLRIFFGLPRLSEDLDLDFVDEDLFALKDFLSDLEKYFSGTLQYKDLETKVSTKENIIYLKFPILDKLELVATGDKTKILFLRIDLAQAIGKKYKVELSLKSTPDFSFLVKRYSLADLFAGKIAAILQRKSLKEPRIKGRDYFDLVWFLEKRTTPNFAYLKEITSLKTKKELVAELESKVKNLDLTILQDDLLPLFKDTNFVKNLIGNYKGLVLRLTPNLWQAGHSWEELAP